MILYNRKKVKYRKDGYCWKKRKDGKTTREDHMKLKVQGVEVSGRKEFPFRGSTQGRRWGGRVFKGWVGLGFGTNLHPGTDKHVSTVSSPTALMETVTCCSRRPSPRSRTKKQCGTTIVFPGKAVEWNRLFVPY